MYYHDDLVGTLAIHKKNLAAFAYDNNWIKNGFSISPYSLPLKEKVFIPERNPFEGLFGVFADSLPDGWGRLLVDRMLLKYGNVPSEIGVLDRLAIVGSSGMGALTYKPVFEMKNSSFEMTYDEIARECEKILREESSDSLDSLFEQGGSSGGARPKILTKVNSEDWIIKFPSSYDSHDIGKQEYDYTLCAQKCGIITENVRLFSSKYCTGYFGTRRFDRTKDNKRIHMVSVAGLLETSHRIPNLDYNILMKLTIQLTRDMTECKKLYRLMCFNVFAHNRDDHAKNFTYQYIENEAKWILSPAYDLTYSNSIGGEHATTINGEGKNPGLKDLVAVAKAIGISEGEAKKIALEIQEIVVSDLREYL